MKRLLTCIALVGVLGFCAPVDAGLISYSTTWTDGQVLTHSALNGNFTDVTDQVNNNLDEANLAATITFASGDFIDFSADDSSTTTDGIRLPQGTAPSGGTADGQIVWDTDDDRLCVGDGSAIQCLDYSGDFGLSQASPSFLMRDSTDDVAYLLHLDTAAGQQPVDHFTLWRGTSTGLGNFTVNPVSPLMQFDSSNDFHLPQTAGTSEQCLRISPGGKVTATTCQQSFTGSFVEVSGQTTDIFIAFGATGSNTLQDKVDWSRISTTMTASNLNCGINAAPGGGETWTFTLQADGNDTSLTCAISGAVSQQCTDTSNAPVILADTFLILSMDETSASADTDGMSCTVEFEE